MYQVDEDQVDQIILVDESLFEDASERAKHVSTVKSLAKDVEEPLENVAHTYENVLQQYKKDAQIQDYLPVLVAKKVKEVFRERHRSA